MRPRAAAVALAAALGGALLAPSVPLAEEAPAPPTAALEAPFDSVDVGKTLKLDSSGSIAGATPIVGHVWDLDGNGSFETDTGTDPTAQLKPDTAGPLTVHVRVVDQGGQSSDAELDLTVTEPAKKIVDTGTVTNGDAAAPATAAAPAPAADPAAAADPTASGGPGDPPVADDPKAPSAPVQPSEPAAPSLGTPQMSAAPALVPRRALAARASAQGKTQPVADVHAAGSTGVTIKDFKFNPSTSTVKVGDTITWTNQDIAPHTATASDGSFDTGTIDKGKSGSHTFTKTGTFAYICSIHPSMKGTVTVTAAVGGTDSGASGSGDSGTSSPDSSSGKGGSDLPLTGLNVLLVVALAALMCGSGTLLRRRVG